MEENKSQSVVTILLEDGTPSGVRTIEIANWNGIAYAVYRPLVPAFIKNNKLGSCFYFLIGKNDDGKHVFYIGQTEDIKMRFTQHLEKKDFWEQIIVFSGTGLTVAYTLWLEQAFYNELKNANRVDVNNENTPAGANLAKRDIVIAQQYKKQAYIVLGVLGFVDINKKITVTGGKGIEETFVTGGKRIEEPTEIYLCTRKGASGKMVVLPDGYILLEGSVLLPDNPNHKDESFMKATYRLRDELRGTGKLKDRDDGKIDLLEPHIFNSPTSAAKFVICASADGLVEWKVNGKTLKEMQSINEDEESNESV